MNLILKLAGSVGLLIAGGTIIFIMVATKRKGYIRLVEPNETIQTIELGAGVGLVGLGLFTAFWHCLRAR